jgi:bacteriorhodopsin
VSHFLAIQRKDPQVNLFDFFTLGFSFVWLGVFVCFILFFVCFLFRQGFPV